MGKIFVIGIGPGSIDEMSIRARTAVENSEVIVGYKTYIDLIQNLTTGKKIVANGMMN